MACVLKSCSRLQVSGWEGGAIVAASEATASWGKGNVGVHEGINTEARRMRPIQLALLAMAQVRTNSPPFAGARSKRKVACGSSTPAQAETAWGIFAGQPRLPD